MTMPSAAQLEGIRQLATTRYVTFFADTLQSIAHDVEIEPVLLPFEGENLPGRTANRSTAARLDIRARSFWTRQQDAFFDVRVTNPKAMARNASHFAANWPTSRSNEFRQKNQKKNGAGQDTLSSLELEEPRSPSSRTIV